MNMTDSQLAMSEDYQDGFQDGWDAALREFRGDATTVGGDARPFGVIAFFVVLAVFSAILWLVAEIRK